MSRYRVYAYKVMYHDKVYYNVKSEYALLKKYIEYVREIGDEAYMIDNELYIDEGAFFNISMWDNESVIQVQ